MHNLLLSPLYPYSLTFPYFSLNRLIYFLGDSTGAVDSLVLSTAIEFLVTKAMSDSLLCRSIIARATYLNVTALLTVSARNEIMGLCGQTPIFASVYRQAAVGPSSPIPSSPPSEAPLREPPKVLLNGTLTGFLAIILLIGIFRFSPTIVSLFVKKKISPVGHLYDILVVLNDEEEAILENIRHEDIPYYRLTPGKIKIDDGQEDVSMSKWLMNDSLCILERRVEVMFLDQYDLLGGSKEDTEETTEVVGNKAVTRGTYLHDASLRVGMIIRVKPARDYDRGLDKDKSPPTARGKSAPTTADSSIRSSEDSHNRPMTGRLSSKGSRRIQNDARSSRRICPDFIEEKEDLDNVSHSHRRLQRGQSAHVLDQLPYCFSTFMSNSVDPQDIGIGVNRTTQEQDSQSEDATVHPLRIPSVDEAGEFVLSDDEGDTATPMRTYSGSQGSRFLKIEKYSDCEDDADSVSIDLSGAPSSQTEVGLNHYKRRSWQQQQYFKNNRHSMRKNIDWNTQKEISSNSNGPYSARTAVSVSASVASSPGGFSVISLHPLQSLRGTVHVPDIAVEEKEQDEPRYRGLLGLNERIGKKGDRTSPSSPANTDVTETLQRRRLARRHSITSPSHLSWNPFDSDEDSCGEQNSISRKERSQKMSKKRDGKGEKDKVHTSDGRLSIDVD